MFYDIDLKIAQTLKEVFKGSELEDNIHPVIGDENISRPLRFPAIKIVFLGFRQTDNLDLSDIQRVTSIRYGVVYYFRRFKDKNAESVYPNLLKIVDALGHLETDRGVLEVESCQLVNGEGYFAYVVECGIETVI